MNSRIVSTLKEVATGEQFRIVADEGTEEEIVYTMLDPRLDEGETEIGPLTNVIPENLVGGHLVLRDSFGPVRVIGTVSR